MVKIQLNHFCIGDGSYIDFHKFFWGLIFAKIPGMCKGEQSVKNEFKGITLALRSHDQFEASHWLTLLPPLSPGVVDCPRVAGARLAKSTPSVKCP